MNANALREWLSLYDREMRGGIESSPMSQWETQGAYRQRAGADAYNNNSRRMMWAQKMMGGQEQQAPDFFGGEEMHRPISYVAPQRREMAAPQNFLAMMMRRA